jgi:hypothetical protein
MIPVLALIALTLKPWDGADLPTATQAAVKYRLTISGEPGSTLSLKTTGVATGWIAAFCDNRVCSPSEVSEIIPKSGRVALQFELIREDDHAVHSTGAQIHSSDGQTIVVPRATR